MPTRYWWTSYCNAYVGVNIHCILLGDVAGGSSSIKMEEGIAKSSVMIQSITRFVSYDISSIREKMRMTHCARLLNRSDHDSLRSRLIVRHPDVTQCKHHKNHYKSDELVDIWNNDSVIILLTQKYERFCNELSVCGNEITETIMNFRSLCTD